MTRTCWAASSHTYLSSIPTPSEAKAEETPSRLLTGSGDSPSRCRQTPSNPGPLSYEKASAGTINSTCPVNLSDARSASHPLRNDLRDGGGETRNTSLGRDLLGTRPPRAETGCCEVERLRIATGGISTADVWVMSRDSSYKSLIGITGPHESGDR